MKILRLALFDATEDQLTTYFSLTHQEKSLVETETKHVVVKTLFDTRLNHHVVQMAFNNKYFYIKKEQSQLWIMATDTAMHFGLNTIFNGLKTAANGKSVSAWSAFVAQVENNYQQRQADPEFQTKVASIKENIAKTKEVMDEDIEKIRKRQQNLCCLLVRIEALSHCTQSFKSRAFSLYKQKDLSMMAKMSRLFCCFNAGETYTVHPAISPVHPEEARSAVSKGRS